MSYLFDVSTLEDLGARFLPIVDDPSLIDALTPAEQALFALWLTGYMLGIDKGFNIGARPIEAVLAERVA